MDEPEVYAMCEMVEEKESCSRSPFSTNKAIYCEKLPKHPSTKAQSLGESRMKFVTQGSLLRAVQRAKIDVGSILRQSVCGSEISTYRNQSIHSNSSPNHSIRHKKISSFSCTANTRKAISVDSNSSKKETFVLYSENLKSNHKNQQVCELNFTSPERKMKIDCPSKTKAEEPQSFIQGQQPLTNEEFKWLGKNYIHMGGKHIFTKTNSPYLHIIENSSPLQSKPLVVKNNKVHTAANELINRVQLREQQLWKQIAEMSISSHSPSEATNVLEENFELLSTNWPVLTVADETPKEQCQSDTYVVRAPEDNELAIIDTENVLDLLDDEWFDNLLRAELEIT